MTLIQKVERIIYHHNYQYLKFHIVVLNTITYNKLTDYLRNPSYSEVDETFIDQIYNGIFQ